MKIESTHKIIPSYSLDEELVYGLRITDFAEAAGEDLRNPILRHQQRDNQEPRDVHIATFGELMATSQVMRAVKQAEFRFADYGELRGLWLDSHPKRAVAILPSEIEFHTKVIYQAGQTNKPCTLCLFSMLGQGFELCWLPYDFEDIWDRFWGFLVVREG